MNITEQAPELSAEEKKDKVIKDLAKAPKDTDGNLFLGKSIIYHFYGVKKRDYFGFWVQQDLVVKAPPRHSIHYLEPIEEVITELTKKGYKYEVI
jgi:hypothetical protein